MAINKIEQSGHVQYGLATYAVDTDDDIERLPVDDPMGSTAIVIDNGKVYMLKSTGAWKEI